MAGPACTGGGQLSGLFDEALGIKELHRAGWKCAGIDSPESVAAHSWGVAWLVMNLCPNHIDAARALKIALVHDLPEVIAGDITPHDGISKAQKRVLENDAAEALFRRRPDLKALWQEYEDGATPEAKLVKECDALDMALQAVRYGRQAGADTAEFITSARAKIRTPALLDLLEQSMQS